MEEKKENLYRIGITILILLTALSLGEYGIGAVGLNIFIVFFVISLIKTFFVVRDYMHIGKLFNDEEA